MPWKQERCAPASFRAVRRDLRYSSGIPWPGFEDSPKGISWCSGGAHGGEFCLTLASLGRGCVVGGLDACLLARVGRAEFSSPLRYGGSAGLRWLVVRQFPAAVFAGCRSHSSGSFVVPGRRMAALFWKASVRRDGIHVGPALSVPGKSAFPISYLSAGDSVVVAAASRL